MGGEYFGNKVTKGLAKAVLILSWVVIMKQLPPVPELGNILNIGGGTGLLAYLCLSVLFVCLSKIPYNCASYTTFVVLLTMQSLSTISLFPTQRTKRVLL